jgi:hypothetical protein
MFFELTEGQNRNLGDGAAPGAGAPAPTERDPQQATEGAI